VRFVFSEREIMKETLAAQIAQLTMKREQNKLELFEKEALRLRNKELFFVHGESIPVEQRIALDSEIAHLEADRQRTKVELLKLKRQAMEVRETKLITCLMESLTAHGLQSEIDKARAAADDALAHAGLFEAYRANL
jgi:hypothetical protein